MKYCNFCTNLYTEGWSREGLYRKKVSIYSNRHLES